MRGKTTQVVLLALAAGLLTACSGGSEPVDQPAEGGPSVGFPIGRYEATADGPYQFVTFHPGGTLDVERETSPAQFEGNGGSYDVDGNVIRIRDSYCQTGIARYEWAWDGTLLTMTPVGKDACAARQAGLAEMKQIYGAFPVGAYESANPVEGRAYGAVSFMPDGGLLVEEADGAGGAGGSYVAIGQEITISDYYCAGKGQETAHYTWTWDGATLAMKPAGKDTCVARRTALEELTPVG